MRTTIATTLKRVIALGVAIAMIFGLWTVAGFVKVAADDNDIPTSSLKVKAEYKYSSDEGGNPVADLTQPVAGSTKVPDLTQPVPIGDPILQTTPVAGEAVASNRRAYVKEGATSYFDAEPSPEDGYEAKTEAGEGEVLVGDAVYQQKNTGAGDIAGENELADANGYIFTKYYPPVENPAAGQCKVGEYVYEQKKVTEEVKPAEDEAADANGLIYKAKTSDADSNNHEVQNGDYVYHQLKDGEAVLTDAQTVSGGYVYLKAKEYVVKAIVDGVEKDLSEGNGSFDVAAGTVTYDGITFIIVFPTEIGVVESQQVAIDANPVQNPGYLYGNKESEISLSGIAIQNANVFEGIAIQFITPGVDYIDITPTGDGTYVIKTNKFLKENSTVAIYAVIQGTSGTYYASAKTNCTVNAPSVTSLNITNENQYETEVGGVKKTFIKGNTVTLSYGGEGFTKDMVVAPGSNNVSLVENIINAEYTADGEYTIGITDDVNHSENIAKTVTLDNTAPVINDIQSTVTDNTETVSFTVNDDGCGVKNVNVKIGENELPLTHQDGRYSFVVPKDSNGAVYTIEALDNLDNKGTADGNSLPNISVTKVTNPKVTGEGENPSYYDQNMKFTVEVTGADAGEVVRGGYTVEAYLNEDDPENAIAKKGNIAWVQDPENPNVYRAELFISDQKIKGEGFFAREEFTGTVTKVIVKIYKTADNKRVADSGEVNGIVDTTAPLLSEVRAVDCDFYTKRVDEDTSNLFIYNIEKESKNRQTTIIPEKDENGKIKRDENGKIIWKTVSADYIEISFSIEERHFDADAYAAALTAEKAYSYVGYEADSENNTYTFTIKVPQPYEEGKENTGFITIKLPDIQDILENHANGRTDHTTEIVAGSSMTAPGAVSMDADGLFNIGFYYDAQPSYSELASLNFTIDSDAASLNYDEEGTRTFYKEGDNGFTVTMTDGSGAGIKEIRYSVVDEDGCVSEATSAGEITLDEQGNGRFTLSFNSEKESNGLVLYVTAIDNAGNSRTGYMEFNVDTKNPEIAEPTITSTDTDPKTDAATGTVYYKSDFTYAFTLSDLNLKKAEVKYTYVDIASGEQRTGTGTYTEATEETSATASFTITDGQKLLSYSITAWDKAGDEIATKEIICSPEHKTVKTDGLEPAAEPVTINKVSDSTAPVLEIIQSEQEKERIKDNEEYYGKKLIYDIKVTDLNLQTKKVKYTLESSADPIEFDLTPSETEEFTWVGQIELDDTGTEHPEIRGDVLTGLTLQIDDFAGNVVSDDNIANVNNTTTLGLTRAEGEDKANTLIKTGKDVVVDKQAPEITVSMPSEAETDIANKYADDNRLYYNAEQTVTVKVVEANLDLNVENTKISYNIQKDNTTNNKTVEFKDESYETDDVKFTVSEDGTTYEAVITISDGQCLSDFTVVATDLAGNESKNENYKNKKYIVDETAPSLDVKVSGDGVVEAGFFENLGAIYVTFDTPVKEALGKDPQSSNKSVTLTATVKDRNIMFNKENSGFSKENFVKGKLDLQEWSVDGPPEINTNKESTLTYTKKIDVPADKTGTMVFELDVQDLAGNRTDDNNYTSNIKNYLPINAGKVGGTLVADRTRPTFKLTPDPETPAVTTLDPETLLYNSNMNYKLEVKDPAVKDASGADRYSGLKSVKWEVTADNDAKITTTDGKTSNIVVFEGDEKGIQSKEITIPLFISEEERGESDNVHLKITVTDQAGNETTYDQKLAMDNQKPVIESVTANASFYKNNNKLFLYMDKQKKDSFNVDKDGTKDEQDPDDIEVTFVIRELNFNASDYETALKENERIKNINYNYDGKDKHTFSFKLAQNKNETEQIAIVLPPVTDLAENALVLDPEDTHNRRQNTEDIIGTAEDQSAGEGAVSYDKNVPTINFWYDAQPPYSTLDDLRFTVTSTKFYYWKDDVRTFYKKGINRFAVAMKDGNGSGIDPGKEDGYGNASKAELFFRVDDPTGKIVTPTERTEFELDEKGQGLFELQLAPGMEDDGMKLYITATDNVGNSRTAYLDFNVDTKNPTISGPVIEPDDTPVKTDSKNNKYYNHKLRYTFNTQDRNLARTELTYSYLDILTNEVITPDTIVDESTTTKDPTGTDIVQKVAFTIQNGQKLLRYRVTTWDDAGREIVDKEYSCNPMHTRSKSETNIKKVVDLTAPTLTVSQSDRTPNGEHDSEAYYANEVVFNVEVFDLNIEKKDTTYDLETGSGKVLKLSRKTNTPGSIDYFTYAGSFTLDDKNADPANRGDVLTGFKAVIEDYAGHTVTRVRGKNNLNLNDNIKGDTITMGKYSEDGKTRSIVVDKLKPKIQIKLPNTDTLVYDKTVPEIKFDGSATNTNKDGNTFYYNSQQNVSVSVVDTNLHPEETSLVYYTTVEGNTTGHVVVFNEAQVIYDWTSATYTFKLTLEDGVTFSGLKINKAEDYAKNKKENYTGVSSYSYIIDTTAPTLDLNVSGEGITNLFTNGSGVYVTFDNPSNAESGVAAPQGTRSVTLTATVSDRNIQNDINTGYKNNYYVTGTIDGGSVWYADGTPEINKGSSVVYSRTISVPADSSNAIVFGLDIQDLAGNRPADNSYTSNYLINDAPNVKANLPLVQGRVGGSITADRERLSSTGSAPIIDIIEPAAAATLDGGKKLYSGSMSYNMNVVDPIFNDAGSAERYSGLSSVSWTVTADNGAVISTGGTPNNFSGEQSASFVIPVSISGQGETNNIELLVTAIDQTGNTITRKQQLGIDNQAPRVTVSYDNQSFQNERYYKEDRNLTIRIEDLNFDPTRTTVTTEPGFSGWSQNGNVYTGTVSYSTDGDYKFEMATTDKAGNVATIDYTNGGANTNPQDFTVDKTKPVITVVFDNNKYLNEKYYKAQRTATITIDEHNFRAADVTTTVRAALDGQSITIPAQSGWSGSTDERVSTIPFKENGDYTINVTYTDLAGNEAEPLVVNEFTVDTVMPEATITNVKNKTAYKGAISPQIRFYDVNFDPRGYSVLWHLTKLDGTKKLTTEKAGTYSEITHGTVFSFNNLPSTPENDGIYELSASITDLAGNSFETEEVMYSVNRFGSVYDVEDWPETKNLLGNYTNKAPVINIRETNPNILTEFSITASVNGAARELVEGQDFDVVKVENNGSWKQYIYTIYDSAFMNGDTLVQGEYNLTLYSKDEAGNLNSNRTNNSNLDIAFTIDAETPSGFINVNGLAEGKDNIQAPETAIRVNWEDNIGIERVDIYLNDTLYASLTGEDLAKAAGSYELIVQEKDEEQNVYAVLTDMAGNEIYLDPISFYLNSSGFRQFVRNTPLFVGTICGIAAAAALIIFLIVRRRKKNDKAS